MIELFVAISHPQDFDRTAGCDLVDNFGRQKRLKKSKQNKIVSSDRRFWLSQDSSRFRDEKLRGLVAVAYYSKFCGERSGVAHVRSGEAHALVCL